MVHGHAQAQVDATVPWRFSESGAFQQWLWDTHDFEALVICEEGDWSWQVTTKEFQRLAFGIGVDFDSCADQTLEAVGKAYPPEAGYGRWTHDASRKYTLATGVRFSLADAEGQMVRVFLIDGKHADGRLVLGDWLMHLDQEGPAGQVTRWDVDPTKVKSVGKLR